jgi:hypothetical protein
LLCGSAAEEFGDRVAVLLGVSMPGMWPQPGSMTTWAPMMAAAIG